MINMFFQIPDGLGYFLKHDLLKLVNDVHTFSNIVEWIFFTNRLIDISLFILLSKHKQQLSKNIKHHLKSMQSIYFSLDINILAINALLKIDRIKVLKATKHHLIVIDLALKLLEKMKSFKSAIAPKIEAILKHKNDFV